MVCLYGCLSDPATKIHRLHMARLFGLSIGDPYSYVVGCECVDRHTRDVREKRKTLTGQAETEERARQRTEANVGIFKVCQSFAGIAQMIYSIM